LPGTGPLVSATFKSFILDSSLKDIRFYTINQIFTSFLYHYVAQQALPPGVQDTDGFKAPVLLDVGWSVFSSIFLSFVIKMGYILTNFLNLNAPNSIHKPPAMPVRV
jgi:hypothetical protein